ncbi:MAG: 4-hydroxyphenylpyruvate dioxygenase, partial [Crocinitomicaceae bacterium]|nr:4-hydroxyphenylpyruvate dioxygenase [Crocinitomicaceae bacterium]
MSEIKNLQNLKNFEYSLKKEFADAEDFLPLLGTDYIELYVGNAKQSAHFYKTAFGFQSEAYCGLETGVRDRVSYVLKQDKIRLVLTTPLTPGGEINEHINKHGDGVKVIALWVEDAQKAWEETTKRGAKSFMEPRREEDENGYVIRSGIYTYGETVHIFVQRSGYDGAFLPGYRKWESHYNPSPVGLKYVDHMVGNVGWGEMNKWVEFYAKVMGFAQIVSFDDKDISTEYTALMSKVMSNGNGRIKFPINEPAKGKKKSQIEEYIDFYNGAGCQHIAVATDDIVATVSAMRDRGVEFLYVPDNYYDDLF